MSKYIFNLVNQYDSYSYLIAYYLLLKTEILSQKMNEMSAIRSPYLAPPMELNSNTVWERLMMRWYTSNSIDRVLNIFF